MNALEIITVLKKHKVVPRLEGDQLKLVGETKNLSQELIAQIKEQKEALCTFLKGSMGQMAHTPILPVNKQDCYPASNAQRRLWVLSQFEGGSVAYNIVKGLYLKGVVDRENLNTAFRMAVQRHESLRTVFAETAGVLTQVLRNDISFNMEFEDISVQDGIRDYLISETENAANWHFDLENGPLIRVKLFRMSVDEYAMIFGLHHIISDGWSVGVLVQEVMQCYETMCRKTAIIPEPLRIHYKDYTQWLEEKISGPKGARARAFWKNEFPSAFEPLNLPMDTTRPQTRQFDGAAAKYYFSPEFYTSITDFCKSNHITPFNFFRSALTILLYKFSGQKNITIGTPVSGRNHFDLENQIGLYVNTLPLRMDIDPDHSFLDFVKKVSDHSFSAFEFQDYPLDSIIDDLQVKRDVSRNPLFDVMMVLQNTVLGDGTINISKQYGFDLGLLDAYLFAAGQPENVKRAAKFDLSFYFDKDPGSDFYLEIEYATALFGKERIDQFFEAFIHIIRQVLVHPARLIKNVEIVSQEDKQRILHEYNKPIENITENSILTLLEPAFNKQENETAIVTSNSITTYKQLRKSFTKVAAWLSQHTDTSLNPNIGLLMDRSEWTIISILGILKSGAAYVPVDIKYPASRIAYMIADAGLDFIIADDAGLEVLPENFHGTVVHINELMALADVATGTIADEGCLRENRAYLIYTSGSTGKPKGVDICHRNTIAFLKWASVEFAHTDYEIMYAATSYCFDLSIFEFFLPLIQGKTIRLLSSAIDIADYLGIDKKVMINTVPAVVRNLLDTGVSWSAVTALNMAGEIVPWKIKADLDYSVMEVRNLYGPSEDTTYSTVYLFADDQYPFVPIGTPVGYTHLYIMDEYRNLLPDGVDGEIYLSGQSVARGYFNNPLLTADKFLENPFVPGMPMYRTGDVGRWLPDGKVAFSGRIDDQVKVRGIRIELEEIRFLLEQHPQITNAVVLVKPVAGENQLVAYWVGDDTLTADLIRNHLLQSLPVNMVPGYFVKLESIPLNSNGKADKKALPDPIATLKETVVIAPVTKTEMLLLELWKEVLQVDELGITHDFFDAGGHSLKATRLRGLVATRMEKDLSLNEIFNFPTVEKQASLIAAKPKTAVISIQQAEMLSAYPISFTQERLWVLTNFEEASMAYNMPAAFRVSGDLDKDLLQRAFQQVIERYEILRTVFSGKGNEPTQVILSPSSIDFRVEEIVLETALTAEEEQQFLQRQWRQPFNLEEGPLLKCFILKAGNTRLLSFNMHHIISDGWSIVVLYKNVITAYRNLAGNTKVVLPPLELQFKDFAMWQKMPARQEKIQQQLAFWKEQFRDEAPILELPLDFHRPAMKTYDGATLFHQFDPVLSKKINQLSKQCGVSLFTTLMAAANVLLKKYANQNDIVIGTPVAGRDYQQLQDQIGFFVNTLAIRTIIDPAASFQSLLLQQKAILLDAFEHQELPFELLLEELQVMRDLSRSPLFDVMVVLQNLEELEHGDWRTIKPGLELERVAISSGIAKYDLTFSFSELNGRLHLELEYNIGLFTHETITRLVIHLTNLFEQVTDNPEIAVKHITLPDKEEHRILLSKADQTMVGYDHSSTIISLFQEAAVRFPDSTALICGELSVTYRELDTLSGQLAGILIREKGVQPEDLILLHCNRNEWMVICMLAVLKSGAAYVPVDPTYPQGRIDYIIRDSNSKLILYDELPGLETRETWRDRDFTDVRALTFAGEPVVANITPGNLAYVIYTSGTTGNPKGVLIEHRNVTRLLFNDNNLFDFSEKDRWTLFHSYCFDFSVWEMYGALLNGGALVIVPKEVAQNSLSFYDFLKDNRITVLNQTPTAFRSLIQNNRHRLSQPPVSIRYLIFGGEALMPDILSEWHKALPDCKIVNMYGITETTVHVTYKEISAQEIKDNRSNIGLPIPTLSCYVLDNDLQQVPIGVTGELCVGGAGLARGYLNKPEITQQKFITNPLSGNERLYRSGDYARILPSGDIEYIGRKDDQVKIRGHRIETGEIEAAMSTINGIQDVIVLTLKNAGDECELIAYYIWEGASENKHIRKELNELLPAYMVPAYLIALPEFPLNENGKLDRKALPKPQDVTGTTTEFVAGRNETDQQIIAIWENVLEKKGIGIKDNFFELGGNSLKATRVISKIHEVLGVKIDLKNLFVDATVEHLSNFVDTIQWVENDSVTLEEGENEIIF